jgi:hypothetical protein
MNTARPVVIETGILITQQNKWESKTFKKTKKKHNNNRLSEQKFYLPLGQAGYFGISHTQPTICSPSGGHTNDMSG